MIFVLQIQDEKCMESPMYEQLLNSKKVLLLCIHLSNTLLIFNTLIRAKCINKDIKNYKSVAQKVLMKALIWHLFRI